jgi:hypothetical protein
MGAERRFDHRRDPVEALALQPRDDERGPARVVLERVNPPSVLAQGARKRDRAHTGSALDDPAPPSIDLGQQEVQRGGEEGPIAPGQIVPDDDRPVRGASGPAFGLG